jgi:hypothetical protein
MVPLESSNRGQRTDEDQCCEALWRSAGINHWLVQPRMAEESSIAFLRWGNYFTALCTQKIIRPFWTVYSTSRGYDTATAPSARTLAFL